MTEPKDMKYRELQDFAETLENKHDIEINRSLTKVKLLAIVEDVISKHKEVETIPEEKEPEESEPEKVTESEPKVVEESIDEGDNYIATKIYEDWESGWTFDPTDPNNNSPKPIENMTSGLKNAIDKGMVIKAM